MGYLYLFARMRLIEETVMRCCVVLLVGIFCVRADAAVINVPGPNGPTIQAAIDVAVNGDEIIVAPGTYPEQIDFLGKAIFLHSSAGAATTIIDGGGVGPVVTCTSFETVATIIEGFTVRTGSGAVLGGGMFIQFSSPTINDCIFEDNIATRGGGIYVDGGIPRLNRCTFQRNTADGGGMYVNAGSPILVECLFEDNATTNSGLRQGGGMLCTNFSNASLTRCTFINNVADPGSNGGFGGGLANTSNSATVVSECVFDSNTSYNGGAVYCNSSNASFSLCDFRNNTDGIPFGRQGRGGACYSISSSPSFTDCIFADNSIGIGSTDNCCNQGWGGALYLTSGTPLITNCTFSGNIVESRGGSTQGRGGAIYISSTNPIIVGSHFIDNKTSNSLGDGSRGGAIYSESNGLLLEDCTFQNNRAENTDASGGGFGGALYGRFSVVRDCTFDTNRSDVDGGAVYATSDYAIINCLFTGNIGVLGSGIFSSKLGVGSSVTNCSFIGNHTGVSGGIYNDTSTVDVTNCLFSGNTASSFGGGIFNFNNSDGIVTNCTFSGNTAFAGAAMYNFSSSSEPTVNNCIMWGNSVISSDPGIGGPGIAFADTNIIQGGYAPGTNILIVDPAFIDPDGADNIIGTLDDDLRLGASPAIDAGNNGFLPTDIHDLDGDFITVEPIPFDLDGNQRVFDGDGVGGVDVDLGAYEFIGVLDCNSNGISDPLDIISGFSLDLDGNNIPDECDPDCNANGLPDHVEITLGISSDCNGNLMPDECDIAGPVSDDINTNGVPDECEDCNNNLIPDDMDIVSLFSQDCNLNTIPDECDLAAGTSSDLNDDGTPDECEADCDGNGVPDFLDIAFGILADVNEDGVPDICECPADVSVDGSVNVTDLLALLAAWGPNPGHVADINGDDSVNVTDLLALLAAWGVCP